MSDDAKNPGDCDAWNPGISSQIPSALKPLVTLYRPENSTVDFQQASELAGFCGLNPQELIAFRVERLVVHELLVRVTSDLSVPDGPNYEDLGISLRSMVATLFEDYAMPEMAGLQLAFDELRARIAQFIEAELMARLFAVSAAPEADLENESFFKRLFNRRAPAKSTVSQDARESTALAHWAQETGRESCAIRQSSLAALHKVVGSIRAHRGRVLNQPELITEIATNIACNASAGELIAELVAPIFKKGVEQEAYRLLPVQDRPVVMNVKGASASGKSTIRPQQRQLADKLGIPWEDFALISPDYWRKHLLDYQSLGDDYKYAAMLTGQELAIIDKKLDRYMAAKGARGDISHMLIDRFRFDSFNVDIGDHSRDSKLLSRFGDRIFMFFMITPPAETVPRAWHRGQVTGRFKAVDDLLYHNVEAYTGMPDLFFSWVLSGDKQVHFEFLDNSVPKGQVPETAAFGWNNSMTILDIELMQDIERFRKVNIDAKTPDEVLAADEDALNLAFLRRCLSTIANVVFIDKKLGKVYARVADGKLSWSSAGLIEQLPYKNTLDTLFSDLHTAQSKGDESAADATTSADMSAERQYTLGSW